MMLVLFATLMACGAAGLPAASTTPTPAAIPTPATPTPASTPATGSPGLDGTEWALTLLNGSGPLTGSTTTLAFTNPGSFSGVNGCRNYFARYVSRGNDFRITGRGIEDAVTCDMPNGTNQQEAAYFEALRNAAAYRRTGERLEFEDAAGNAILVFALRKPPSVDPVLAGTRWTLVSLNGRTLLAGSNITLDFGKEGAGGYSGCNGYGGKFTAADEGILTFSETSGTLRGCEKGIEEQETAYLDAFRQAAAYRVIDGRLQISDASGNVKLSFTAQPRYAMNPADLVGTMWELVSLNGKNPIKGSVFTLAFAKDKVSGYAGCRGYTADYEANGDEIHFPSNSMTDFDCVRPGNPLEQEGEFTDSFTWARNYRLTADRLEIFTAEGGTLIFRRLSTAGDIQPAPTTWILQTFVEGEREEVVLPETTITLMFDGATLRQHGTISGSAGCNTYTAGYTYANSLVFEPPKATERICDGAGIMEQEQRYLRTLKDATRYRLDGNRLRLELDDGRYLVFIASQ